MKVDAIIITRSENIVLDSVPGYIYFRNNYSKYFRDSSNEIFVRYHSKKLLGIWRIVPNRSTDFYRLDKVGLKAHVVLEELFRSKNGNIKK